MRKIPGSAFNTKRNGSTNRTYYLTNGIAVANADNAQDCYAYYCPDFLSENATITDLNLTYRRDNGAPDSVVLEFVRDDGACGVAATLYSLTAAATGNCITTVTAGGSLPQALDWTTYRYWFKLTVQGATTGVSALYELEITYQPNILD